MYMFIIAQHTRLSQPSPVTLDSRGKKSVRGNFFHGILIE